MRVFLRIFIWLFVTVWVGGLVYFPAVAAVAFSQLANKEQAGAIVRSCLVILHTEGILCGLILLVLLFGASATNAFGRNVLGPVCCTVAMLGLTLYSQYHVIPRMERDRIAVGGDIDARPSDPRSADFNRLHAASEELEEGVLFAGVLMLGLLARGPRTAGGGASAPAAPEYQAPRYQAPRYQA